MIKYVTGDLFESSAQALVNPVSCDGSMRTGISSEMKCRFPNMFNSYVEMCRNNEVMIGRIDAYVEMDIKRKAIIKILNIPTRNKGDSHLDYIKSCLVSIGNYILKNNLESIAIPALGCGSGRLKWLDVRKLIEQWHADNPDLRTVIIEVYLPIEPKR